jgi:hypothetical protein
MKIGKRRRDAAPVTETVSLAVADGPSQGAPETWTSPRADTPPQEPAAVEPSEPEPVVDGEAVELPPESSPPQPPFARPVPVSMPEPVAPIAAAPAPAAAATPVASSVDGAAPAATAHAFDGHAPDPPVHPIEVLAAERPELVVGAAFAGGILAAMILRRLGN